MGIDLDKTVTRTYTLKEDFKQDAFYKQGFVFMNERVVKSRSDVTGLLPSVRDKIYSYTASTGRTGEDTVFEENNTANSLTDFRFGKYSFRL